MYFCLRIDLDYVPWDTPDAKEFGHGEPAMVLRLLENARHTGTKFHFFASNRALQAFPTLVDALLSEGHDLDWYCKHPEDAGERHAQAQQHFAEQGHSVQGLAVRGVWPAEYKPFTGINDYRFLSAEPGLQPPGHFRFFPVETRVLRQVLLSGSNIRLWTDQVKTHLRDRATRKIGVTLAVRPQVLAKHDPRLTHLNEIVRMAGAAGLEMMTLREVLASEAPASKVAESDPGN